MIAKVSEGELSIMKPPEIANMNEMYQEGLNRLKILNINSKGWLDEFIAYTGPNKYPLCSDTDCVYRILENSGYLSYFVLCDQGEEYELTYYLLVSKNKTLWRRERYELQHHCNTLSFCERGYHFDYCAHYGGLKKIHIRPGNWPNNWNECACTYNLFLAGMYGKWL